jgi:PAS domain S-box-containing protein
MTPDVRAALGDLALDVEAVADALPQIVWFTDASGDVDYFNARWFAVTGRSADESYGTRWLDALHPDDAAHAAEAWGRAVTTGEAYEVEYRFRYADGTYRWQLARGTPIRDAAGVVARWLGTCTDIHAQKRAEFSLSILARVGDALNAGLDEASMLGNAARILVPEVAEWCFVFLKTENENLTPVAIVHADREQEEAAIDFLRRYPIREGYPTDTVVRTGHMLARSQIDDESYRARGEDERHIAALIAFDVRSIVVVPIRARDEIFGALHFARTSTGAPFEHAETRVMETLGKRFAVAIENARNYARERTVAATFQRAALPKSLPAISGLVLDAVYNAAASESQVGGDWYDAFQLDDGRVAISVGDVSGKGLDAAVVMANVRQALRVAAFRALDPATMLAVAETALEREHPDRMVTAFVGFLDLRARSLTYASAGHPAPIVRRADGTVAVLATEAPPLGLGMAASLALRTIAGLDDGTIVTLYTDGLIESTRDVLEGERRLLAAIASEAVLHTSNPAAFIRDSVLHDGVRDDVAVLTVLMGNRAHWSFDASDAMAAHGARAPFMRALRENGADDADYGAAELIFGELVGNVVRHAPGKIEIDLVWTAEAPVLHVLDRGSSFDLAAVLPRDIMQESGRGLFLVELLGEDFMVDALPRRGNHARVTLPIRRAANGR